MNAVNFSNKSGRATLFVDGKKKSFNSVAALRRYCKENNIVVELSNCTAK